MAKFVLIVPLMMVASILVDLSASAQRLGQDACARDVSRHCRAVMNAGDQVVLACLKQNRARISRACQKILADHGQ